MKRWLVIFVVVMLGARYCHNQHMMHKYKPNTYHKSVVAESSQVDQ